MEPVTYGPPTEEMREAFARALDLALAATPTPTAEIAARVGVTRDAVRKWATNKGLPDPLTVFGLERLLGLAPGELSRHLGYVPAGAPPSVTAAIEGDPRLTDDARRVLLGAYMYAQEPGRH